MTLIFGALLLAQTVVAPVAAAAATIQTNLYVYQSGDTVQVTGSGFGAGETVVLVTTDPAANPVNQGSAPADATGNVAYSFVLNATLPGIYTVSATGQTSGLTASTQFDPPMSPPGGLSFTDKRALPGGEVDLIWNPVAGADCYFVYEASSSISQIGSNDHQYCGSSHSGSNPVPIAQVATPSYQRTSAPAGALYYVVTAAQSSGGWESQISNQVTTAWFTPGAGSDLHSFGSVTVNSPSSAAPFSYSNGDGTMTVGTVTVSGPNAADFAVSGQSPVPGRNLSSSGPLTFNVTFTPSAIGPRSADIVVAGSATNSSVSSFRWIPVTGSGLGIPTTLTVGSATGTYGGSTTLTATLTAGTTPLNGKSISFTLNGTAVGSATTNASGVATLSNASLAGIGAGTYSSGVSATFAGDTVYAAASATPNVLEVQRAVLHVNANNAFAAYGDTPTLTPYLTGYMGTDTSANLVPTGSASCALTVTLPKPVGTYTDAVSCTPGTLSTPNYTFTTGLAGSLTVGQRAITITADSKSKSYGDADPALTYQVTSGSLLTGETFSGTLTRAAGESVGTYAIQQGTVALSTNYALAYIGADLAITARPVTVAADAKTKVYGQADPELTYHVTSGSLVTGDSFGGALTRAAGENAGSYAIEQGTLALSANYALTYVGANLTITAAPLTVTADPQTKVYGDADPALTYTVTSGSLVGGDHITGAPSRVSGEDVGTYAIEQGSLSAGANYTITFIGAQLTITPRPVTITADAKTKVYGAADPALTYQITSGSVVPGDAFTGTLTRAAGEDVGAYAIGQGSVALTANYSLTYVGANLTITPRPVTVTADVQGKVYGDADPVLTYVVTSGTVVGGDSFTGHLVRDVGEDVGDYAIRQGTLSLGTNYDLTYAGADLSITARPVTVTADSQTKTYGAADPALTYQVTSGSLAFSDHFSGQLTRDSGEGVGSYAIRQGTLALSSNYDLSYTGASLTITARPVTVTADAVTKVYGASDPVLTYQVTSGSLAFQDTFSGQLARASGENAGTYAINQGTLALSSNYALSYVGADLTITARPVTVTAAAATKVLGASDPLPFQYAITSGSLVGLDAFTGALSRTAGESVGTYPINQGTLALTSNYQLTYVGANLTITYAGPSVTCFGAPAGQVLTPVTSNSRFKQGSTVPIKFRLCDANGNSIGGQPDGQVFANVATAAGSASYEPLGIGNGGDSSTDLEPVVSTTPDSNFRWDATSQQWIFNLSTSDLKSGKHYYYEIDLQDGEHIYFDFGIK